MLRRLRDVFLCSTPRSFPSSFSSRLQHDNSINRYDGDGESDSVGKDDEQHGYSSQLSIIVIDPSQCGGSHLGPPLPQSHDSDSVRQGSNISAIISLIITFPTPPISSILQRHRTTSRRRQS